MVLMVLSAFREGGVSNDKVVELTVRMDVKDDFDTVDPRLGLEW